MLPGHILSFGAPNSLHIALICSISVEAGISGANRSSSARMQPAALDTGKNRK